MLTNTVITILWIVSLILALYALKNILGAFSSSEEHNVRTSCKQVDLGFNHYTTGIIAEEIVSGRDIIRKTYQFRCPTTRSSGWVTGVKTGGVAVRIDCCGKLCTTLTVEQLENLLEK